MLEQEGAVSLTMNVEGLEEAAELMEVWPEGLAAQLTLAMETSLGVVEGEVKGRMPIDSGESRESITHEIISPFPNLIGEVGSPLLQVLVIEKGRRPKKRMPPMEVIKAWIIRNPDKVKVARGEEEEVAWLIARSIGSKGFSPRGSIGPTGAKMFEEGFDAAQPIVNERFQLAVRETIKRYYG